MPGMNFKTVLVPVAALGLLVAGYLSYGPPGIAAVAGAGLMWLLLHYTRMIQVLRRAGRRPIGQVGSAVMLNARLRPGLPLLQVLALTRALGELRSPQGAQPEVYRWSDGSGSWVEAEFGQGRLRHWQLHRPPTDGA